MGRLGGSVVLMIGHSPSYGLRRAGPLSEGAEGPGEGMGAAETAEHRRWGWR